MMTFSNLTAGTLQTVLRCGTNDIRRSFQLRIQRVRNGLVWELLLSAFAANPVGGFLCGTSGGNHQPLVFFELLEPAVEVSGLVFDDCRPDTDVSAEKRSGHFGDQFFASIVGTAEGLGVCVEFPVEAFAVAGAVGIMPTSA